MSLNESVSTLQTLLSSLKPNDAKFAADLIASYKRYGSLTPRQAPWIERLILRAQAPVAPVVVDVTPEAVNVGGFEGVIALFTAAKAHLKFPKITLVCGDKQLKLSLLGSASKFAGSVNITNGGKYPYAIWYGRVSPDGTFTASSKLLQEYKDAFSALLKEFSLNPARVAKEHGKLTGNCCFCNKALGLGEDKRSVIVGFGPVCADHYGLKAEWLNGVAKAEATAEVAPKAEEVAQVIVEAPEAQEVVIEEVALVEEPKSLTSLAAAYAAFPCFFCDEIVPGTKVVMSHAVCPGCAKQLAGVAQ